MSTQICTCVESERYYVADQKVGLRYRKPLLHYLPYYYITVASSGFGGKLEFFLDESGMLAFHGDSHMDVHIGVDAVGAVRRSSVGQNPHRRDELTSICTIACAT